MHRCYMNAETRDALIAESQRLIAAARAQRASPRQDSDPDVDSGWAHTMPPELDESAPEGTETASAFAALVSDLWSLSASSRQEQQVQQAPAWGSGLAR